MSKVKNFEKSYFTEFDRMAHSAGIDAICVEFSQKRQEEELWSTEGAF